jgi:hypothetical protein
MFSRSAGSAVGIAVFGAVVNATLGGHGVESDRVAPAALTAAVHHVFVGTVLLAGAMLAAVLLMPRGRAETRTPAQENTGEMATG